MDDAVQYGMSGSLPAIEDRAGRDSSCSRATPNLAQPAAFRSRRFLGRALASRAIRDIRDDGRREGGSGRSAWR